MAGEGRHDRRLHPGGRGRPRRRGYACRRRVRPCCGQTPAIGPDRRLPRALAGTSSTRTARTARRCRPTTPTSASFGPQSKGRRVATSWRVTGQVGDQTYRQVFSLDRRRSHDARRSPCEQRVAASRKAVWVWPWRRGWPAWTCWPARTRARSRPPTSKMRTFPTAGFARRRPRPAISAPAASTCRAPPRRRPPSRSASGVRGDVRQGDRDEGFFDGDSAVSPRAAVTWALQPTLLVRGSLGWSFRAPTLNERYRGFRAGNVVTQPNPTADAGAPPFGRGRRGVVAARWRRARDGLPQRPRRRGDQRHHHDDARLSSRAGARMSAASTRGAARWKGSGGCRHARRDRRPGPDAVALCGLPAARRTDGAPGAHVAGQCRHARHRPPRAGAVVAAARVRRAVRRRSQHPRARVRGRRRRLRAARRRAVARRSSSISRTCSTTSTKSADRQWRRTASRSRCMPASALQFPI